MAYPLLWNSIQFDPSLGRVPGRPALTRRLSDLRAAFVNQSACDQILNLGDPAVYQVTQIEDQEGEGQLHYGLGIIMPGKVGDEYYMTKGHLHAWRPAAEVYIGLQGQGFMLLEDERTGKSTALPLSADRVVYVPGHTAHRTINTGNEALVYWGILSSQAGHDYGAKDRYDFRKVIVEIDGEPVVLDRDQYVDRLKADKR
ncbi:MAG: glucose-6-phosphate isomerase [Caldilineaceae bacterium]|nr:glucose-6-phosphate isomerase [Caldilineaceae bacterium]HRJ42592.1 glucose-6-phosphate isomerase family protein [Caldilineaceae bacterium]